MRARRDSPTTSTIEVIEAALLGLKMVLQCDQKTLQRSQRRDTDDDRKRTPQQRVHPERRLVDELDDQRRTRDDEPGNEDDEHRRSVAGVGEGIIEAAGLAARPNCEQPVEQPALSAV